MDVVVVILTCFSFFKEGRKTIRCDCWFFDVLGCDTLDVGIHFYSWVGQLERKNKGAEWAQQLLACLFTLDLSFFRFLSNCIWSSLEAMQSFVWFATWLHGARTPWKTYSFSSSFYFFFFIFGRPTFSRVLRSTKIQDLNFLLFPQITLFRRLPCTNICLNSTFDVENSFHLRWENNTTIYLSKQN